MINLSALVSPKIEKFILFRVITYHIHTKMAKKYEFHTMNFMPLRLFFGPLRLFLALFLWLGSGSKTFLEITYVDNQLPIFSLLIQPNLGPFGTFGAFQSYFWGQSQVQNLFWELLIYTNNFFFKCSSISLTINCPIFSLLIQPNLGPFGTFGAFQSYFWGWSQVQNLFWELLIYTNNFFFKCSSISLF